MNLFVPITYENIDKARLVLSGLKYDHTGGTEKMLEKELEQKIKQFEEESEADLDQAVRQEDVVSKSKYKKKVD